MKIKYSPGQNVRARPQQGQSFLRNASHLFIPVISAPVATRVNCFPVEECRIAKCFTMLVFKDWRGWGRGVIICFGPRRGNIPWLGEEQYMSLTKGMYGGVCLRACKLYALIILLRTHQGSFYTIVSFLGFSRESTKNCF